jgi:hypothetical protein
VVAVSYPNPVSDIVKINAPEKSEVKIYNINGDIVYETLLSGTREIRLSHLIKGMYLFKVVAPGVLYTGRFIKN